MKLHHRSTPLVLGGLLDLDGRKDWGPVRRRVERAGRYRVVGCRRSAQEVWTGRWEQRAELDWDLVEEALGPTGWETLRAIDVVVTEEIEVVFLLDA